MQKAKIRSVALNSSVASLCEVKGADAAVEVDLPPARPTQRVVG